MKLDNQLFWRERLSSSNTSLISTALHLRLFHRPPFVSSDPCTTVSLTSDRVIDRLCLDAPATCTPFSPATTAPFFSSKGSIKSFSGNLNFFHCPASSLEGLQCPEVPTFMLLSAASTYVNAFNWTWRRRLSLVLAVVFFHYANARKVLI